jgi:long-chain acyl-CoA synthetase
VIYTSHETRTPTPVQLTHSDVAARIAALRERLALRSGWRVISWQPMADIAERCWTHYLPLTYGWQVTTCADPGAITTLLPEIRPEFFSAPPRLWDEVRASVLVRFDGEPERAAADSAAVLAGLGLEQVRIALVAASCPPDVVRFWRVMGVPLNIEELCSQ